MDEHDYLAPTNAAADPMAAIRRAAAAAGQDPDEVAARAATLDLDELDPPPARPPEPTVEQQVDADLGLGEQMGLIDEGLVSLTYENLCDPADVAAYKRVKAAEQQIAREARKIAARLVGGTIGDGDRSKKEFVRTHRGLYRFATSEQSDNSTETAMHERMGITASIHLPVIDEVVAWFDEHGLDGRLAYQALVRDLRARFRP